MQHETFVWEIRVIDPDTSLNALTLKVNLPLLTAHTRSLNRAIRIAPKIREIYAIGQNCWEWMTPVARRPLIFAERSDEMRATSIDCFLELCSAPFTRHNARRDEFCSLLAQAKKRASAACSSLGDAPRRRFKFLARYQTARC